MGAGWQEVLVVGFAGFFSGVVGMRGFGVFAGGFGGSVVVGCGFLVV